MIRAACLLLALALSGCATVAGNEEIAWQALNIVDAGQTTTIARNPDDFGEVGIPTGALIGFHPSEKDVVITMAGYALIHFGVYEWLSYEDDRHPDTAWGTALKCFEVGSLLDTGYSVVNNNRQGIKPWGSSNK